MSGRTTTPWRRRASALSLSLLLAAAAAPAGATTLLFESREITTDAPPFSRNVYRCPTCSVADWDDVVLPGANWEKASPKLFLPDAVAVLPTPPAGVPATLDLIPTLPGDDHEFVARVLDGTLLQLDPTFGFLGLAHVERDTVFTYAAGEVIHEVTDDAGQRYVLFSFDLDASQTWDVTQVDGIAGYLSLPAGWSYSSRVASHDESYASGGVATVFAMGGMASFQLVPEPATGLLVMGGMALLARRRRPRTL
jgi:hypothetical protein